jgi:ubiquinone/menaquinone biosynthesis C-methylase UbiE
MRSAPRNWLNGLQLKEGMVVADLGAGKGLYSVLAAGLVGAGGHVYAVEPDPKRAAIIRTRAAKGGLQNIEVVQSGVEDMRDVPSSSVDVAFSRNSLHHFRDRGEAFAQILRIIREGGSFYIRDAIWTWWTRHGTRKEEIPMLNSFGFKNVRVNVSGRTLEATLSK